MQEELKMKNEISDDFNEDLDHIVLKERQRILLSRKMLGLAQPIVQKGVSSALSAFDAREVGDQQLTKAENYDTTVRMGSPSEGAFCQVPRNSAVRQGLKYGSCGQRINILKDCYCRSSEPSIYCCLEQISCDIDKSDADIRSLPQNPSLLDHSVRINLESSDSFLSSLPDSTNGFVGTYVPVLKVKNEIPDDFNEDIDYIVLQERQSILLSRISAICSPNASGGESSVKTSQICSRLIGLENADNDLPEGDRTHPCEKVAMELYSSEGRGYNPVNANNMHDLNSSTLAEVKDEPCDSVDNHKSDDNDVGNFSPNILPVKSELKVHDKIDGSELDEMPLQDRIKLQTSTINYGSRHRNYGFLKKTIPSAFKCSPVISDSTRPMCIYRLRKKRKTATDSIETVLEEDAPGLLQVLFEKGVTVDEIKLYGEMENHEALDESLCEEGFAELEAVISKLFSERHSFLKFAPVRCTKALRASYCLTYLISLVEQARYLQFRKWPAEWGWCRDLQSFIFVFERHNRIVLERPEYGYATYFFELVDSLPIDWQTKRLVTVMKLTSCSRISLLENKPLLVGEDLSEGEAKVLRDYGWLANSGLGTMLNYCDRVVHDRKNETDSSEWRSKIGKLLMDGYNGGRLVAINMAREILGCGDAQNPEVKLEV